MALSEEIIRKVLDEINRGNGLDDAIKSVVGKTQQAVSSDEIAELRLRIMKIIEVAAPEEGNKFVIVKDSEHLTSTASEELEAKIQIILEAQKDVAEKIAQIFDQSGSAPVSKSMEKFFDEEGVVAEIIEKINADRDEEKITDVLAADIRIIQIANENNLAPSVSSGISLPAVTKSLPSQAKEVAVLLGEMHKKFAAIGLKYESKTVKMAEEDNNSDAEAHIVKAYFPSSYEGDTNLLEMNESNVRDLARCLEKGYQPDQKQRLSTTIISSGTSEQLKSLLRNSNGLITKSLGGLGAAVFDPSGGPIVEKLRDGRN